MLQFHPYMMFNGNCEEAFNFYKSVFGGEFQNINRYNELPAGEGPEVGAEQGNLIMNIALPINNETTLMGGDAHPAYGEVPFGKNITLHINAPNREEVDRIFEALSEGGQISMPLEDVFWSAYFGMCEDKYGMGWMVSCDNRK